MVGKGSKLVKHQSSRARDSRLDRSFEKAATKKDADEDKSRFQRNFSSLEPRRLELLESLTSSSHTKLHNILSEQNSIPMDSCTVRAHFNLIHKTAARNEKNFRRNL